MNNKTKEFREEIAKEFIKSLEEEQKTWHKSWSGTSLRPQNINGNRYRGINNLYLSILCAKNGWEDPRFATFNQIKKNGWHLQKGAKGVQVEYWFPYNKETKKTLSWNDYKHLSAADKQKVLIIPKYYYVFNGRDIEGLPPLPGVERREINPDVLISTLSKNMNVEIMNDGGDRAYYSPAQDQIHLPVPEVFDDDYAYNSTALHELAHASGAEHRLARDLSGHFGSKSYVYEELVAEISSSFMATHLERSDFQIDNHKAYIQSWIEMVQKDPNILIKAIKDAEKCADYLEFKAELLPEKEYTKRLQLPDQVDENGQTMDSEKAVIPGKELGKEKELAFSVADRFFHIQESEHGYEYSVINKDYKILDGGFYDNPDVSIKEALDDIVNDIKNGASNPEVKGSMKPEDILKQVDCEELSERIEQARDYDQNRRNEIRKDIIKSGYRPNDKMISHIRSIECNIGHKTTLKELAQLHKNIATDPSKSLVEKDLEKVAEMCKQQELAQARAVPVMEA